MNADTLIAYVQESLDGVKENNVSVFTGTLPLGIREQLEEHFIVTPGWMGYTKFEGKKT